MLFDCETKIIVPASMWMNLENIMLSKASQKDIDSFLFNVG